MKTKNGTLTLEFVTGLDSTRTIPARTPTLLQRHLQSSRQKLRLPIPKTPILLAVLNTSHQQITAFKTTLSLQMLRQLSVELLLNLRRTTLLEDLDENQLIRTFQAQIRVLADDLVRFVLGDDLDGGAGLVQGPMPGLCTLVYKREERTTSLMVRWDKRHT